MLLRLILFLVIAYIVWSALKSTLRSGQRKPAGRVRSAEQGEEMVLDPQCRSYVPKSSAIAQSGQYFCSPECARIYLAR